MSRFVEPLYQNTGLRLWTCLWIKRCISSLLFGLFSLYSITNIKLKFSGMIRTMFHWKIKTQDLCNPKQICWIMNIVGHPPMTQVNAKIPTTVESTVVWVIAWAKQETSHCPNQCWARGLFRQRFSILIQIGGQILGFRVTPSLGTISLQNCTHTTTVPKSCHVRNLTVNPLVKKNPTIAEWNFHQTCFNMDKLFAVTWAQDLCCHTAPLS